MTSASTASPSSFTLKSRAQVATERPARYAKQLVAHMGRKLQADWDSEAEQGYLNFIREGKLSASCTLKCKDGALVLEISLPNSPAADDLARIEQVVGIHLARFGSKDSLAVQWQREDGSAGTLQGPLTPEEVAAHHRAKEERRAREAQAAVKA